MEAWICGGEAGFHRISLDSANVRRVIRFDGLAEGWCCRPEGASGFDKTDGRRVAGQKRSGHGEAESDRGNQSSLSGRRILLISEGRWIWDEFLRAGEI